MKPIMFQIVLLIAPCALIGLSAASAHAADDPSPLLTVSWEKLKAEGRLKTGEVVTDKEGEPGRLKIVNEADGMKSLPLCELRSPPIKSPSYAVRGKIRYQNVVGSGFLEMWNVFAGDERYFSRTMDPEGPMQVVTGSSQEREFELPFHTGGNSPAPEKLILNLVLYGPGTVEIGPLELIAITPMLFNESSSNWWSDQTSGLIGGGGGSLIGILGSVIGLLVGLGKGRRVVLTLACLMTACGAAVLLTGLAAVINQQPFTVWYVLVLMGGMTTFFGVLILSVAPARFRANELRRMQALDIT